jgi:2-iminoacetate synthase
MKLINEERINNLLLPGADTASRKIDEIINKSKSLKRLSLEESAILLAVADTGSIEKIFAAASFIKEQIYGKRVVLFAPLYINNFCCNNCAYCAFKSDNKLLRRKALNAGEIKQQVEWLLERGHKRILMVAGEGAPAGKSNIDYYMESIASIYGADFKGNKIKRVNVNCAPLEACEFKKLKSSGIGTYQLFQETYHEKTYRQVHPSGPKSDPDNRIDALDRAFSAGIDDIGIGVLYGLYDYKFETLAMLSHIQYLERKFNVGPHTISVPRIEPAGGAEFSLYPPYPLSDNDFKKLIAVLRLSVPYTGIILSTREKAGLRDELLSLGISQISAQSHTSPGGYSAVETKQNSATQFDVADHRSLDEVVAALIKKGFIPSFCAACYRKQRTGEAFMNLAKPGLIKGKCSLNALATLQEYLLDFASSKVKVSGERLINRLSRELSENDQKLLKNIFRHIDRGARDEFV